MSAPVGPRLCEVCERPIPWGEHGNTRYHRECRRLARNARQRQGAARGGQMLLPGPRSGRNARSGLQISYAKAVEVLAGWLHAFEPFQDEAVAENAARHVLAGALSERQRQALHNRTTEEVEPSGR